VGHHENGQPSSGSVVEDKSPEILAECDIELAERLVEE